MVAVWLFIFAAVGALGAVVTFFGWAGIGPQHFVSWGRAMAEKKKILRGFVLLAFSWLLCGVGLYKVFSPTVVTVEKPVEKIVEKPVDRIVEKPCPPPAQIATKKMPVKSKPPMSKQTTQSCPNGICIQGGNSGTATVNNIDTRQHLLISDAVEQLLTSNLLMGRFAGRSVVIFLHNANDETYNFGSQLKSALETAGVKVEMNSGMALVGGGGAVPQGVTMEVGVRNMDLLNVLAKTLFETKSVPSPIPVATRKPDTAFLIQIAPLVN